MDSPTTKEEEGKTKGAQILSCRQNELEGRIGLGENFMKFTHDAMDVPVIFVPSLAPWFHLQHGLTVRQLKLD
jgi:hypothetical protein